MTESKELLGTILDIGAALIQCGAETHKTEKNLYRMCDSFGFVDCNIWVIPSDIQASVTTSDGNVITMIRHVRIGSVNYARLYELNDLARSVAEGMVTPENLKQRYEQIKSRDIQKAYVRYLAGILGGTGFAVFFNCNFWDAVVAGVASFLVAFLGRKLSQFEKNPLVYNFVLSFISETLIVLAVHNGIGHHVGDITVGVVMLLISGIGATNGIKDLMHLDTVSGILKLTESLLGAIGIAVGMGLSLFMTKSWATETVAAVNSSEIISLAACVIGCVGFSLWFNVKLKHLALCALGAFLTWGVYLITKTLTVGTFIPIMIASIVCAFYAQLISRIAKAPSTIFMSIAFFPLVPGAALYYMMCGLVTTESELAFSSAIVLAKTCFAIVLGIMVVEVIVRCVRKAIGKLPTIE